MASSFFFLDGAELRPEGAAPLSVTAPASAQDERAEHNVPSPPIPPERPPSRATVYRDSSRLFLGRMMKPGTGDGPVATHAEFAAASKSFMQQASSVDPLQFTHPALAPRTRPSKPPK